jgi:hypothetical protein
MKVNAQCNNCGHVYEVELSILTDKNLSHFIGDFARTKYCYKNGVKCNEETTTRNNEPKLLAEEEWVEIFNNSYIREAWCLDTESLEEFKGMVYAVKFDYVNESPGYVGDFYIIMGSAMMKPVYLTRQGATKQLVENELGE